MQNAMFIAIKTAIIWEILDVLKFILVVNTFETFLCDVCLLSLYCCKSADRKK